MRSLPAMDFDARLRRLREAAGIDGSHAYLVTDLLNVRYLSGFTGSAGIIVVLPDSAVLLTDGRYAESAEAELSGLDITVEAHAGSGRFKVLGKLLKGMKSLYFESTHVTVDFHETLRQELPDVGLIGARHLIEELRLIKDAGEVARMRLAAELSGQAFSDVEGLLETGITELQLAARLESRMTELGADSTAFPSIVASGPNGSKPHARPSERTIREGELVVMDFGAMIDGYLSDMTRMVWWGDLDDRLAHLYGSVLAANRAGVAAVSAGAGYADVDRACRESLRGNGYPDVMAHPAGHNVGLYIHERPFFEESVRTTLDAGNVVTVEPGVYLPGLGGARVEDMVLVTQTGCEVLSTTPKKTI